MWKWRVAAILERGFVVYCPFAAVEDRFLDFDVFCQIEPLSCAWAPTSTGTSVPLYVCDLLGLCRVAAVPPSNKIFGFAEFVQAFALLVLVYTMSDVRYRFRAATAPIPIWAITFWLCGIIGFGTILTDLW